MGTSDSLQGGLRQRTPHHARARTAPRLLERLAARAGIEFNGARPWDIQVRDRSFYRRVMRKGSRGFGEAYVDGLWDSERLDETMTRIVRAGADLQFEGLAALTHRVNDWRHRLWNRQDRRRAVEVAERHYDIGNDLYQAMLDPTMTYSCAYWDKAGTLEEAQRDKLDLICRKLDLRAGERLLDIGCGWGGLAEHAARNYGVKVVGITISKEQHPLAAARCAGLPVDIRLMDYRDLDDSFDKVVSVGMFEHVGVKNYAEFFRTVARVLNDQGLMLLHTIGSWKTTRSNDPWVDRYIFPNSYIPSAREICATFEPVLLLEDWHNFGTDYDRTLMAWWNNFERAWPDLDHTRYDARFYRMWKYYLHLFAGYFRARDGQLWQIVLAKASRRKRYRAVR